MRGAAEDAALADRRRRSSPASRSSLLGDGSSRPGLIAYTLLRLRADDDRGRARARDAGRPARSFELVVAQPPPLRRLRRARLDRAARDRHRRLELVLRPRRTCSSTPGQSVTVAGNTFTFRGDRARARARTRTRSRAVIDVSGRDDGTLKTGINNYFNGDTSREVGIHTNWPRARGPLRDLRPAERQTTSSSSRCS